MPETSCSPKHCSATTYPRWRSSRIASKIENRDRVTDGHKLAGKAYTLARQEPLNGLHAIEFPIYLLRVAGERPLVIWDRSPIHCRPVMEVVAQGKDSVRVAALLGYARDLKDWDEGGWQHLEQVEMLNLLFQNFEELHEQFHLAVTRLRQKPHQVDAVFAEAGLTIQTDPSQMAAVGILGCDSSSQGYSHGGTVATIFP
jgi:hypothetical protein